jgi:hypothetical protein
MDYRRAAVRAHPFPSTLVLLALCACQSARSGPGEKSAGIAASTALGDGIYQRAFAIARAPGEGWVLAGLRTDAAGAGLDGPHPYLLLVDGEGALLWDVALHDDPAGADRPDGELRDVALSADGSRILACGGAHDSTRISSSCGERS